MDMGEKGKGVIGLHSGLRGRALQAWCQGWKLGTYNRRRHLFKQTFSKDVGPKLRVGF